MKASELQDKIRHYHWLKGLAEDYDNQLFRLQREGKAVTVDYIGFTCRSEKTEVLRFNSHRTISPAPFIKAIEKCLKDIKAEMVALRDEIEKIVELD